MNETNELEPIAPSIFWDQGLNFIIFFFFQTNSAAGTPGTPGGMGMAPAPTQQPTFIPQQQWFPPPQQNYYNPPGKLQDFTKTTTNSKFLGASSILF